jgi:hypothetical protein
MKMSEDDREWLKRVGKRTLIVVVVILSPWIIHELNTHQAPQTCRYVECPDGDMYP